MVYQRARGTIGEVVGRNGGAQSATAFIGGTPEETSAEATRLAVPSARLKAGEALGAEENPVAKFDIVSKIPPDAAIANVTVRERQESRAPTATAHISLTSAISGPEYGAGAAVEHAHVQRG